MKNMAKKLMGLILVLALLAGGFAFGENGNENALQAAQKMYNAGDYEGVVNLLLPLEELDEGIRARLIADSYLKAGNIEQAVLWNEAGVKSDPAYHMYRLGRIYTSDEYGMKDMEKGILCFSLSANCGHEYSMMELGIISREMGEIDLACAWFEKVLEKGMENTAEEVYRYTLSALGNLYYFSDYGLEDWGKAAEYYEQAAELDHVLSMYYLGCLLSYEAYGMIDYDRAVGYLERAAEGGNAAAALRLGHLYSCKEHGMVSVENAISWYEKAAAADKIDALTWLGDRYSYEVYEMLNVPLAIEYYEKAVELGNGYAAYRLGGIYSYEPFGMVDAEKAGEAYKTAAELGYEKKEA